MSGMTFFDIQGPDGRWWGGGDWKPDRTSTGYFGIECLGDTLTELAADQPQGKYLVEVYGEATYRMDVTLAPEAAWLAELAQERARLEEAKRLQALPLQLVGRCELMWRMGDDLEADVVDGWLFKGNWAARASAVQDGRDLSAPSVVRELPPPAGYREAKIAALAKLATSPAVLIGFGVGRAKDPEIGHAYYRTESGRDVAIPAGQHFGLRKMLGAGLEASACPVMPALNPDQTTNDALILRRAGEVVGVVAVCHDVRAVIAAPVEGAPHG